MICIKGFLAFSITNIFSAWNTLRSDGRPVGWLVGWFSAAHGCAGDATCPSEPAPPLSLALHQVTPET